MPMPFVGHTCIFIACTGIYRCMRLLVSETYSFATIITKEGYTSLYSLALSLLGAYIGYCLCHTSIYSNLPPNVGNLQYFTSMWVIYWFPLFYSYLWVVYHQDSFMVLVPYNMSNPHNIYKDSIQICPNVVVKDPFFGHLCAKWEIFTQPIV
jgi:hypothetical protein